MIKNTGSLADLSESPAKKKKKRTWPMKACRFCPEPWTPRSGMASKQRTYCYSDECMKRLEEEKAAYGRARYQRLLAQGKQGGPT